MSYLNTIKKIKIDSTERWIVKYYDSAGHRIREVKQVYDPTDYRKNGRARELHTKEQLISILELHKNNV
ncbi:MAG: hypothetical protein CMH62_00520 [Nanoarchaeota archaeon]|jgi:hypothetical protein|nr:hypothetical protein [Nanoarchaeota archaeon]|tara:strand:- start:3632 stop:3838 length:207 start_codon:yes stop_codon:yes gene_type:complete